MKSLKKILAIVLATCMSAGIFAGCGGSGGGEAAPSESSGGEATPASSEAAPPASGDSGESFELKLFHKWPEIGKGRDYFEAAVAAYEEANPNVKVTIECVSDEEAKSKLRVMMGADSQPDVYFSWCGEFCYKFARAGNAWDMTEYLNNDPEWKDSIMPSTLNSYTMDGKVYGIPFRLIGKLFVYNKQIFADNGITEAPKTWDELMATCEKLKGAGVTPIAFGNLQPWPACHYITGFNVACVPSDVRMTDYNYETGEFTDPGYITALNYLKEFNDKGYFNNGVNSMIHDVASENFKAGKAAMFYCETGEFGGLVDQGLEIGVFPMPDVEGNGDKGYIVGAPDGFMISTKSAHPEAGMELLKLFTSNEWQSKTVEELYYPSPIIGVHNEQNTIPSLLEAMNYIENAKGLANWLDTDVHTKVSDAYLPAMQEMLNGTLTPEQVMEKVQEAAQIVKTEEAQ